jgi:septal ring factor EnvC (AmiA/AmiB activator)
MDSLDQVRRDLAAQDAYIHAQSETLQRQLDALTVRQGEHHGANEAHMATAAEYQNYMRGQIATLSSSLERLTAMLQQIVSPRDPT